ncbi:MAG TPA: hypothetical protein ENO03_06710 [Candidatus Aminicenantes bacterium]|nr:hypothetical protein [Candidatus Aminicenantes bacterium]HDT14031.1 hypothetical protein [Candidatus Aminicenantes bacterium]
MLKMRLKATTLLLAGMALLGLASVGTAQAQGFEPLLGVWDVTMEDGSREFVFEFELQDGKLSGRYTGASGTAEMADLTYEDHAVKFSVTVGNGMVIDFTAIVAEGELTGMLSLEFGDAAITGRRRKQTGVDP